MRSFIHFARSVPDIKDNFPEYEASAYLGGLYCTRLISGDRCGDWYEKEGLCAVGRRRWN